MDSDGVCKDCGYYTMSLTRKAKNRTEMYSMLRIDNQEEINYYVSGGAVTDMASKIDNPYSKAPKFTLNQDKIKIGRRERKEIEKLLNNGTTQRAIASLYNVAQSTISYIAKDLGIEKNKGLKKLDHESIREIKVLLKAGDTQTSIAKRFNVSRSVISNISRGKIYDKI